MEAKRVRSIFLLHYGYEDIGFNSLIHVESFQY